MNRVVLTAVLAALLALACRVHVTIWLAGQPVARPPIAGFVVAALVAAAAFLLWMAWRSCRGFRSTPHIRLIPGAAS